MSPHKISETYFLRLILARDFRNAAWVADPIARSNPQVGKVMYGLAILTGGDPLPTDLSIQQELLGHHFVTSAATAAAKRHRLIAVGMVSVITTAVAVGVIFLAAMAICAGLSAGTAMQAMRPEPR